MRIVECLRANMRAAAVAVLTLALAAGGIVVPARSDEDGGISLVRDTETERLLRSWLDPILKVAGIDPQAVHLYLVNDPSINAFVAEGQNIFINTGTLMQLEEPNEIIGIMAHETGHMAGGHLIRTGKGVRAAIIPMLLSMAAGVAVMAAGGGDAGAAIIMGGQQIAEREMLAFTRIQEASADQAGIKYLNATHQSGEGMLKVFQRFEDEYVLSDQHVDKFALSHPAPRDRIDALQALVEASPYRDVKDTPQAVYALAMVRAKVRGYVQNPGEVLNEYPETDTSKAARYARAMAYFRMPDMEKAIAEAQSLVNDEPNNPYFLELLGQLQVARGHVMEGIEPYRKAVHLLPDAPQIRVALAAAMLGTEDPRLSAQAEAELKIVLQQDNEDGFAWYELAEAYSRQGQEGKAELATAERYFVLADYPQAQRFAYFAQQKLMRGSTDWQRASDILLVAQSQQPERR